MEKFLFLWLLWTSLLTHRLGVSASECMKRKFIEITVNYFGGITVNRTVKCDMYFQWTVSDYCCYDKYDRFERNPYCCYSETYKLVLAVGFICLVLLGCSFSLFLCWIYNLPHYLLCLLTCGKFSLNDWTIKNKNSPYVDPSFYSGEPFWARGAEMQHYPLKPMPPKVFYPAPPTKMKYRWDHGELPLFIVASRQFTRNPYSARPQDRHNVPQYHEPNNSNPNSRRNSLSTMASRGTEDVRTQNQGDYSAQYNRTRRGTASSSRKVDIVGSATSRKSLNDTTQINSPPFRPNIDEDDAAQELLDALKFLEEDNRNPTPPPVQWKDEARPRENNGRQEIFIISGSGNNSLVTCQGRGRNSGLQLNQIRPNTTGSLGALDQYGNYMSLSHMGISDSQRLKITANSFNNNNNLGVSVYSMPGVHTNSVLTTVQNYHVVSSNLGNPMETIMEDDSLDEPSRVEVVESSTESSPASTPSISNSSDRSQTSSARNSNIRAVARSSTAAKAGESDYRRQALKRRASTVAAVSIGRGVGSPVMSASINHVLGPTPTARAFVPFNPTLPGSLSENSTATFDSNGNDYENDNAKLKESKQRRNSVV